MLLFSNNEARLLKNPGAHSPNLSTIWPILIIMFGLGLTLAWVGLLVWLPLRLLHLV